MNIIATVELLEAMLSIVIVCGPFTLQPLIFNQKLSPTRPPFSLVRLSLVGEILTALMSTKCGLLQTLT